MSTPSTPSTPSNPPERLRLPMTGRRAISVDGSAWRIVAHASRMEHDGEVYSQANRTSRVVITARQHADGRAHASGRIACDSTVGGSFEVRAGRLAADPETALKAVARDLLDALRAEHGEHSDYAFFARAIPDALRETLDDLPAEHLD